MLAHVTIQCADLAAGAAFVGDPDGNNVEAVSYGPR